MGEAMSGGMNGNEGYLVTMASTRELHDSFYGKVRTPKSIEEPTDLLSNSRYIIEYLLQGVGATNPELIDFLMKANGEFLDSFSLPILSLLAKMTDQLAAERLVDEYGVVDLSAYKDLDQGVLAWRIGATLGYRRAEAQLSARELAQKLGPYLIQELQKMVESVLTVMNQEIEKVKQDIEKYKREVFLAQAIVKLDGTGSLTSALGAVDPHFNAQLEQLNKKAARLVSSSEMMAKNMFKLLDVITNPVESAEAQKITPLVLDVRSSTQSYLN